MIYVTGDCHGNFRRFQPEYFPEQAGMTKNDVVIVAGDFRGTGWNACPSHLPSSAATMKTTTRWNDTLLPSGTVARCIASVLMCCT